jgi:tellurite resistance protein TerC
MPPVASVGSPLLWGGFMLFVFAMLALDLGVFHRKSHAVSFREAAIWSVVWVVLSLGIGGWIYAAHGAAKGTEFLTGYIIEKALSVDNIFVFAVIFATFGIPAAFQHRVLFWGIFGALVLRAAFIMAGGAFLARFHWAIYVFGGILILTGLKLLWQKDLTPDPAGNLFVRLFKRTFPTTTTLHGDKFFTVYNGRRVATPLLIALIAVEATDVVFAVDSVPAIFAVTQDQFIVFTSNICAILGLRSMYFLLGGMMDRFRYLKVGLALILVFVGGKMALMEVYKMPIGVSLGVICGILAASVGGSLLRPLPAPKGSPPPSETTA